jgi:hypothetical protein
MVLTAAITILHRHATGLVLAFAAEAAVAAAACCAERDVFDARHSHLKKKADG